MGPDCVPYVLVFLGRVTICRLYKLTLSYLSPRHSATERQRFRFSVNIFSQSVLEKKVGGGDFLHLGPNPLSADLLKASSFLPTLFSHPPPLTAISTYKVPVAVLCQQKQEPRIDRSYWYNSLSTLHTHTSKQALVTTTGCANDNQFGLRGSPSSST